MADENQQLARRWFQQVWNEKRASAIDEMYDPAGKSHGFPEADSVLEGPSAFKAVHERFCGAFPNLHVTIDEMVSQGDRVAVRWHVDFTHTGDHLGFPATGRDGTMAGSTFLTVKDGRIFEGWNQMDMQGLYQRLQQRE